MVVSSKTAGQAREGVYAIPRLQCSHRRFSGFGAAGGASCKYGGQINNTRQGVFALPQTKILRKRIMDMKQNLLFLNAAHKDIDTIFKEILPKYGREPRNGQIELSHTMLDSLAGKSIALCDAGVGIGKTDAYIVAAAMLHKHNPLRLESANDGDINENDSPFSISTSSIQLQRAIVDDYIPFLSDTLFREGMINEPFSGEIQKGKRNYACRDKMIYRLNTANLEQKNPVQREALLKLKEEYDLDRIPNLSGYDRAKVCVPDSCLSPCEHSDICPYMRHVMRARVHPDLFQICNHHYLLADAMLREQEKQPLLPLYRGLIVDEAHLLYEAVQTVCGLEISMKSVNRLLNGLRNERMNTIANMLASTFDQLFRAFFQQAGSNELYQRSSECRLTLKSAAIALESAKRSILSFDRTRRLQKQLDDFHTVLDRFYSGNESFYCFSELDDTGYPSLRTVAKSYRTKLDKLFWSKPIGIVLTSGTLTTGKDMKFVKSRLGLSNKDHIDESITPSPFDYTNNSLLYLPKHMPPCSDRELFREAAADEIGKLVTATCGHTLVLFTSYNEMKDIFGRLRDIGLQYPLYAMFAHGDQYLAAFRASGNGILLNTKLEGLDYPGDQVSSLIIPRLPFPRRDALHQGSKNSYRETREFVIEVALPEMLLKLRQATGRGIRLMTDTCVISILDSRCAPEGRYYHDVRGALPPYPQTRELEDVESFIRRKKSPDYFIDGVA